MSIRESESLWDQVSAQTGFVASVSLVMVNPSEATAGHVQQWVSLQDPRQIRCDIRTVDHDGTTPGADTCLVEALACVEGEFVVVIGSGNVPSFPRVLDAIAEMFISGGDAAVIGGVGVESRLVGDVCRWLWAGGVGSTAESVIVRRFAARWLFAGLDTDGGLAAEVESRAAGMALRLVVPGRGVINPPPEWVEEPTSRVVVEL